MTSPPMVGSGAVGAVPSGRLSGADAMAGRALGVFSATGAVAYRAPQAASAVPPAATADR